MRALLVLALALLALASLPTDGAAQRDVRLRVSLPAAAARATTPPSVRAEYVFTDPRVADLLRNGFPARLHYRVELWSTAGWFNSLRQAVEWDVIVRYSSLDQRYLVARVDAEDRVTQLGAYEALRDVERVVSQPYEPPITPRGRREELYYVVVLDVEMISVSDLDEVERWLRGELRPAVRGEQNAGTAITRGVRTLFVKILGGSSRRYEAKSGRFRPRG